MSILNKAKLAKLQKDIFKLEDKLSKLRKQQKDVNNEITRTRETIKNKKTQLKNLK